MSKDIQIKTKNHMTISHQRGYISITGDLVNETVQSFIPEALVPLVRDAKQHPFHITLATKEELRHVDKELFLKSCMQLEEKSFMSLGIGGGNGVYFHVIHMPEANKIRSQFSLVQKDFHITLTEKDNHDMDKDISSIIYETQLKDYQITDIIRNPETPLSLLLHLFWNNPSEKIFSVIMLYYRNDIECATNFAKTMIEEHPTWSAPYICMGDVFYKRNAYKMAMLSYLAAWHKTIKDQERNYIILRTNKCSQHTEWGEIFTEEEKDSLTHLDKVWISCLPNTLYLTMFAELQQESDHVSELQMDSRLRNYALLQSKPFVWYKLPRFFRWMIPFQLCVMSTPRCKSDIKSDDIDVLKQLGIQTVVTLTEEEPLPSEWFDDQIENIFLPVTNYKAPTFAQIETFVTIVTSGKRTLVHCGGGKGRAGTFVACYIAACGFTLQRKEQPIFSSTRVIEIVRQMRPGSIETKEQEQFIASYISHLWKGGSTTVEEPDFPLEIKGSFPTKPSLIVCSGLQGSGKSYVAEQLKKNSSYVIISQDELGNKDACFEQLHRALKGKNKIIVDRCNPDSVARKEWISAAFNPNDAVCLYFDLPVELCIQRADSRTNHPTIKQGRSSTAIKSTAKRMQPPSIGEGFKCVCVIKSKRAVEELLGKFGINSVNETKELDVPLETTLAKFPELAICSTWVRHREMI